MKELPPPMLDEDLDALWSTLPQSLESAFWAVLEPSRRLSQAHKNGNGSGGHADPAPGIEAVREALGWLRNTPAAARSRDAWVAIGHAVAGATGKSPEGRLAFLDWSAQWSDGAKAMDDAERLWEGISIENVFVGWHWLATLADDESAGKAGLLAATDFADAFDEPMPELPESDAFDEPRRERATEEEIFAAIAKLEANSSPGEIEAVLILLVGHNELTLENAFREIKTRTRHSLGTLRSTYGQLVRASDNIERDAGKRLANATLALIGEGRVAYHNETWLIYNGKFWERVGSPLIHKKMQEAIAADTGLLVTIGQTRAQAMNTVIMQAMKLLEAMTCTVFARSQNLEFALRPAINLRNGTVWVEPKTGEVKFGPHKPEDLFMYACEVDYNPGAECPRYLELVRAVMTRTAYVLLPGDTHYENARNICERTGASEKHPTMTKRGDFLWTEGGRQVFVADMTENVRLLEELMGYALIPWRGASAFAIWKGNGRNGKSLLIETLKRFLSKEAVITRRLEDFREDQFMLSELEGKLLFVDDDLNYQALLPDGTIKKISENKSVNAADKHKSAKHFICTTFPILLCNSWPRSKDLSYGLRSRLIVVPFNRAFTDAEQRVNPWQEVWANDDEMSGILNRWLAALARVLRRGSIEVSRASQDALQIWLNSNSPEVEFLAESCVTEKPDNAKAQGDTLADLYLAYRGWYLGMTGANNYIHSRRRFRDFLEQMNYKIGRSGRGEYVTGLWLRDASLRDGGVEFGMFD